ncbi:hypothetical protein [Arthrobacter antibioticus]|uniref:hypothetical protein n=1 Tax=Arthrobacter sp. H35-MC1 TaxID=3046203 RepID=UPI0024B9A4C0|nr:hypothetical protein [Arthrobacter sp. H35-MC1]MDJ0318625.1 hypothetical protein [Arthrobacter sp. H35-MC1]
MTNSDAKIMCKESICTSLREQGVQVAARTYRAWKTRLPALRAIEDAKVIDTLRSLKE